MAGWIKMRLGTEVGLDPGDIVLDGDSAPPPLKGHSSSNFRLMSVVAKRRHGWTKTPLGMEVGLGPGDFVLDEDPGPPLSLKRGSPCPQFSARVYSAQTAG